MTDKKIADDNEIIENLTEFLITATNGYSSSLENGGIIDEYQEHFIKTLTDSVNLINCQKAEIEKLKLELLSSNAKRKALLEASSKFAGHSNYHGDTILCKLICMAEGQEVGIAIPLDMSEMKANAYKEFAERLCEGKVSNDKTVIEAKVLLKEMVGEQ